MQIVQCHAIELRQQTPRLLNRNIIETNCQATVCPRRYDSGHFGLYFNDTFRKFQNCFGITWILKFMVTHRIVSYRSYSNNILALAFDLKICRDVAIKWLLFRTQTFETPSKYIIVLIEIDYMEYIFWWSDILRIDWFFTLLDFDLLVTPLPMACHYWFV